MDNFRSRLGLREEAGLGALPLMESIDGENWAEREFGGAPLGDKRLSQRLVEIGLDKAIQTARKMANINSRTKIRLVYYPKSRSLFNQIFKYFSVNVNNLLNPINNLECFLLEIQNKPLFLMPYSLNFK